MNYASFHKEKLRDKSNPLTWRYNRRENWLKFYPNQINN